jgi:hypothetical protein
MSKTEYVLVPKRFLEQVEKDRQRMYAIAEEGNLSASALLRGNLTSTMWKLGNTVFKPYNAGGGES